LNVIKFYPAPIRKQEKPVSHLPKENPEFSVFLDMSKVFR